MIQDKSKMIFHHPSEEGISKIPFEGKQDVTSSKDHIGK